MNTKQLNSSSANILVVDDIADNLRVLSASLTDRGYRVRCAKNGKMALITARKNPPQLILLDIKMPDMDGYQVCQRLKADELTREIPIIFLSALDDVFDKVKAFKVGGVDYITKPFQAEEVIVRVRHQLDLQTAKAQLAQLNNHLEHKVQQRTEELEEVIDRLNLEIAEHQITQARLAYQALHDTLTGLPNRALFMEHLHKAIARSQRNPDYLYAVLFIDLDRFKIVNDSWGHVVGDRLLVSIASILQECSRELDTVARLGGDEFAILLEDILAVKDATAIAERILERLTKPIQLERRKVFSGASIGIVVGKDNYQGSVDLLRDADIAMYRAKALGKGRYSVFEPAMYSQTIDLSQLETDLHSALENREFALFYRPIVSLKTNRLIGFEASIRWHHPQAGLITPKKFMAIAEDTDLIIPIGEWMLHQACQQLRTWQSQFPLAKSLYMSVNLSNKQVRQPNFIERLAKMLTTTGLPGKNLTLELTETMLMDEDEKILELLEQIKQQQIKLSINNFGIDDSGLNRLPSFPVDTIKLDRSFVSLINPEDNNHQTFKTILTQAHSLGIKAIAKGVETTSQIAHLTNLGCQAAQGDIFAKPLNLPLAESIVANNPKW